MDLQPLLDDVTALPSAGVVRVDDGDSVLLEQAWGLADRAHSVPMTPQHRVAVASGSKAFTAVTVLSLVADGTLSLGTSARSLLGDDLPEIDDAVTIAHLLAHRSGIGEYLDDDADPSAYLLPGAMSSYLGPEDFLPVLAGRPQQFAPDSDFQYCNGGYIVLSLLAERAAGRPWADLVRERVLTPAGMTDTDFFRFDEPAADIATAYILVGDRWRTTVHHLPIVAGGDGGLHTTALDVRRFWTALFAGRLLPADLLREALREHTAETDDHHAQGLGFTLPAPGAVSLEGEDAGASFWSRHQDGRTVTVLSTTSDGAWPLVPFLKERLTSPPVA